MTRILSSALAADRNASQADQLEARLVSPSGGQAIKADWQD
jgi:hypothetical protein